VRYFRAYRFMFDSPNWFANVGLVTLGILSTAVVPLVGQLVALGYLFEVVEAMHRQGHDRSYPDFTWDRFVPYLVRGVHVFLIQFVASFPTIVLGIGAYVGIIAYLVSSGPAGPDPLELGAIVGGCFVAFLLLSLMMTLLVTPLMLRAGLSQNLAIIFSPAFVVDYFRRMWWPTLKAELFLSVSGLVVTVAGALCFCIGMYAGVALALIARCHMQYQLYQLYLERGGTSIPLKEEPRPLPVEGYQEPPVVMPVGHEEGIRAKDDQDRFTR
jgi:hypothetical protein